MAKNIGHWLVTQAEFSTGLEQSFAPFFTGLVRGSMSVELFKPEGEDTQQPHVQDEIYIIQSGASDFLRDGERVSVAVGDVIFVPAGMEHRFVDFSPDFATWVFFWGPDGGENSGGENSGSDSDGEETSGGKG